MDSRTWSATVHEVAKELDLTKHTSLVAQLVMNLPAMDETCYDSWVRKISWRKIGYPLQYSWASLVAQMEKNLPAMWETWV